MVQSKSQTQVVFYAHFSIFKQKRNTLYKTTWIIKKYSEKFRPILDTLVSGSPIIQDGKLVGAVTHVLVNDPTTGYGIFIENMLDAAA